MPTAAHSVALHVFNWHCALVVSGCVVTDEHYICSVLAMHAQYLTHTLHYTACFTNTIETASHRLSSDH
jgi:hypothetical protein